LTKAFKKLKMLRMCKYISNTHIMPGYICCQCRCYNGLQRVKTRQAEGAIQVVTLCKYSLDGNHKAGCEILDLPTAGIVQCAACFAGFDTNLDGTPQMPIKDLTGKRFNDRFCPVCNSLFVKRTPETDKNFTGKAR
jgi:hypothetical protein